MVPRLYRKPWIVIAVIAVITVFFALQLPKLRVENDIRQWLSENNAARKTLSETDDEFGSTYLIGISFETQEKTILTAKNLTIFKNVLDKIEAIENVEKVDSLVNIDYVSSEDGGLSATPIVSEDLFQYNEETGTEEFIGTEDDIREIRKKMVDWEEMYDLVIISDDYKASQMQIVLKHKTIDNDGNEISVSTYDRMDVLHEVQKIVIDATRDTNLKYAIYGDPVISDDARSFMFSDLLSLIPLVVVVVLLTLFFSFKTADGTILPLLTVLIATIWSCGLIALLGVQFTLISSVIPVALIAVGSAYGIHVMTHYYIALDEALNSGKTLTKELHAEIIFAGLKDVFQAVLLAGVTTIIGFISLITSPLVPLHSFAIFSSFGIFLSLVLALTLVPCLLLLKPLNKVGKKSKRMEKLIAKAKAKAEKELEKVKGRTSGGGSTYYKVYQALAGTKPRLILFSLLIVSFSIAGFRKLVVDTAFINYFPEDAKIRKDVDYINEKFAGTNALYMLVSKDDSVSKADEIASDASQEGNSRNDGVVSDAESDAFDFDSMDFGDFDEIASEASQEGNSRNDMDATNTTETLDMTNVELLTFLDEMQNYLQSQYSEIGKVVSFTTFVKRMNQVMNTPYSNTENAVAGFDDPNVSYRKMLESNVTAEKMLEMFEEAYDECGGRDNVSVKDIVEILEKRFNYDGTAFYEIPYDTKKYPVISRKDLNNLVSQYLMLLGGDTLERFVVPHGSFNPEKLRVQFQIRSHSTTLVGEIIKAGNAYAKKYLPQGYKIEWTGGGQLENVMTDMVVSSQFISLIFSLLCVFVIIAISFKSAWAGLLGAIPLAFTILLNYMVMGFTGIKLDLITSIIASVAIGVGIDYTIHFLETFRNERHLNDDMEIVLQNTFDKSGTGIMTNAIAVGLGFLVLCLSKFVVLRYIGVLVAIVMFSSSILALTIIPGFLHLYDPKFMKK